MYGVPDNYDSYVAYERENERQDRLAKRYQYEEEYEIDKLPFYDDEMEEDE